MENEKSLGERQWFTQKQAERCMKALERNNIESFYARNRDEARKKILKMIPEKATIGAGSSLTLAEIGIMEALEKRGTNRIYNPYRKDGEEYFPPLERVTEIIEIGKKAIMAEVFLTGINAVTLDGKLVNTDGFGNRAAALVFGPERVIAVSGINKIVANLDEALRRIKEVAAPLNARRLQERWGCPATPCGKTGICVDCKDTRHCIYTVIVEGQTWPKRIEVLLVGEFLGY